MNMAHEATRKKLPFKQAFLGSFIATLCGWIALLLFELLTTHGPVHFDKTGVVPSTAVPFVLVVWLAILLSIYCETALDFAIWHWPISTLIGALSGLLIMDVFLFILSPNVQISLERFIFNPLALRAALVGATTGLVAGLTAKYFYANRPR